MIDCCIGTGRKGEEGCKAFERDRKIHATTGNGFVLSRESKAVGVLLFGELFFYFRNANGNMIVIADNAVLGLRKHLIDTLSSAAALPGMTGENIAIK